jgi:type IV secretory pathway TrbF-like protein
MSLFKRPSVRYATSPEPVTPYQKAAQAWDDCMGSARVQARNWRLMAFCCLALSGGLAGALTWQSTQGTIVPYVVEVDELGQLVNYCIRRNYIIVDRLFAAAELRLGDRQRVVRIVRTDGVRRAAERHVGADS